MGRTEGDSWDISENVGTTALATAMVRAAETTRDDRLTADPFAQHFLDAAVAQGWKNPYATEAWNRNEYDDPAVARFRQASTDWAACRTRFIDDFLTAGGERQIVILAAGLDARAWRLTWSDGTVVYELDQPGVLEFKDTTMRSQDAEPATARRAVPIDLRHDWPAALTPAGFDPGMPTAWVAEGLLPYLPPAAQDLLFERIHQFSAAGSRLVVDAYTPEFYANTAETFRRMNETTREEVYSGEQLFFAGERADVVEWLADRGWSTRAAVAVDVMAKFGRPAPDGVPAGSLSSTFVTAHRRQ
ncbi:SAM-dependent methyltransferase [Mycobacterium sp. NPDC050041]|uniref:SAM-dependent methyltransferase n=1 Tax=Mycobacterium sp. NPDC050041 TaxID=3364293 RepID=UPI003C2FF921